MDHDRAGAGLKRATPDRTVEAAGENCRLLVRLTPKSARDPIEGVETLADGRDFLKVRVRAEPEKGKANAALVTHLAKALGLPTSSVAVVSGAKSRLKTVRVDVAQSEVAARLGKLP